MALTRPDESPRKRRRVTADFRGSPHSCQLAHRNTSQPTWDQELIHDLKAILDIIPNCATLARSTVTQDHPATQELLIIEQVAKRATELIKSLEEPPLTESLTEASEQLEVPTSTVRHYPLVSDSAASRSIQAATPPPTPLDLSAFAHEMVAILHYVAGDSLHLTVIVPYNTLPIYATAQQVEHLLVNIIANARDAIAPYQGALTITVKSEYIACSSNLTPGWYVRIDFTDTGCGIPRPLQTVIFKERISFKPPGIGFGFGLSACQDIIAELGGQLSVASEVGVGTIFTLLLPAVAPTIPPYAIIAMDRQEQVKTLAKLVETCGYKAHIAVSAAHVLQLALLNTPTIHILIADPFFTPSDGQKVALVLEEHTPHIRMLFLTEPNFDPSLFTPEIRAQVTILPWDSPPETLMATIKQLVEQEGSNRSIH